MAVFSAATGAGLSATAARVAEETLRQELRLLTGERDPQADLGEVAARLDLALRITHPEGLPSSRGTLVIAQVRRDAVVVGATGTGTVAVFEADEAVRVSTPKAAGRISRTLGGRLDTGLPVVRLGWARLPPLIRSQRLILACGPTTSRTSPASVVELLRPTHPDALPQQLQAIASAGGNPHLGVLVLPARPLAALTTPTSRRPLSADSLFPDHELEDDPDTIDTGDSVDPLATHHGEVPFVLGRLDRWLIDARRRGARRGPDISLLGARDWTDVTVPTRRSAPARPRPRTAPWVDPSLAPASPYRRLTVLSMILVAVTFVWLTG